MVPCLPVHAGKFSEVGPAHQALQVFSTGQTHVVEAHSMVLLLHLSMCRHGQILASHLCSCLDPQPNQSLAHASSIRHRLAATTWTTRTTACRAYSCAEKTLMCPTLPSPPPLSSKCLALDAILALKHAPCVKCLRQINHQGNQLHVWRNGVRCLTLGRGRWIRGEEVV